MVAMPKLPEFAGRPQGLAVLIAIVVVGLLSSSVLLRWGWRRVESANVHNRQVLESASKDPMLRVDKWLVYGEPQIQNRLAKLRFSSLHPGLITHRVIREDGPAEIWGIDLSGSHPARIERDGLTITIVLPEPRLLGHGELSGMNANQIPEYPQGVAAVDVEARAQLLCEHFLGGLREAFEGDIPGTQLLFRFEDPPAAGSSYERG